LGTNIADHSTYILILEAEKTYGPKEMIHFSHLDQLLKKIASQISTHILRHQSHPGAAKKLQEQMENSQEEMLQTTYAFS